MAAAVLSGILQGLWEMAHPILLSDSTFAFASATQRWGYATLSVIKSLGFFAGLFGLFIVGTKRGRIVKIFMGKVVQSFSSVRSKKNLMPQMAMVEVLRE